MTRRAMLPPNTVEINGVRVNLYASADASEHVALYLVAVHRMIRAGAPITVRYIDSCIAGDLVQVTYPPTGEQLARAVYDRMVQQGAPRTALRVREEATT